MVMDKVLRGWWVKWITKPNPDTVTGETEIAVRVSELNKLVGIVRRAERLRIIKLRKPN